MQPVPQHLRERVRDELEAIPAIDRHAHLLRREESSFSLGDDAAPLSEFVLEDGLVALKTIAAFRSGLDLPTPNRDEAAAGYERWRRTGSARLTDPAVISFFLFDALRLTEDHRLPLQVHTGLVGADIDLRAGDPTPLRKLLVLPALHDVPVVLLHCYPFIREASWLAGLFPNVCVDLCMVLQSVVHRGPDLILEALDVAPVSKLLFATDGFRVPELFYLGAKWWRDDLAHVLAGFIDRGLVDQVRAMEWDEFVLRGNALRIYPFAEEQRR